MSQLLPHSAMHSADYAVARCPPVCYIHVCRNGKTCPQTFFTLG